MMTLLAAILGAVIITGNTAGSTIIEYGKQPLDEGLVEQVSTQHIQHVGFSSEDQRQAIVQYAYKLGGIDFVTMIECESGFNPKAIGDSGRAYGLCQMNNRWHKVTDLYKNSWEEQIRVCYEKWKGGTKFYGPQRKIKGQLCKDYVLDRFIIIG